MFSVLVVLCTAFDAAAQSRPVPTEATDVTNAQLTTVLKNAPPDGASDQQIRVVDMGKYNVAVGVLHRSAKPARQGAIGHALVTEVYYILKGSGTLVTGGAFVNPTPSPAEGTIVKILVGPSTSGTAVQNGQSRNVGPGDIIVIPPGVAHWFSAVESDIDYLVVRVDAEHVLPSGYVNPLLQK
jgi:mannose-6-phosphate isomerase-like protein (cupin superfamily)